LNRRVSFALAAPAVAVPFQAVQLALVLEHDAHPAPWQALAAANLILLVGLCALAADFPLAGRNGRALLVGAAIPLLLPGPTVVDTVAKMFASGADPTPWLPFLFLYLLLLLMLGCAEAGLYLLATRRNVSTD